MIAIMACGCRHQYQDKQYGVGQRVHNECEQGWRCTVCGATKQKSASAKPAKGNEDE